VSLMVSTASRLLLRCVFTPLPAFGINYNIVARIINPNRGAQLEQYFARPSVNNALIIIYKADMMSSYASFTVRNG
jgi:hypothetical protein